MGCNDRKASPKQAENVGVGSVTPLSVPANLAVKPDKKWYLVCSGGSLATGGTTPKASTVKKLTFEACFAFEMGSGDHLFKLSTSDNTDNATVHATAKNNNEG